ncbi:hypothetical protein [Streptomyces melanogenes]|uniref:hypothetical protein n=1 Tax=Streptomyces melanogenes TaxID=67326 RepID=UPI00167D4B2E|nr:hypothetical protein [Streptomyces melanogenes]GGP91513.1 hypothetical protein GCM10010278_82240 [Streptomyces melanogenes]
MQIGKIAVSAAMATAAVAATALPASAAGKAFSGPEFIAATKLTAPTTVEFAYRCKPGKKREINVGLSAMVNGRPATDANQWLPSKQVVCNNKTQHVTLKLTKYQFGLDRKIQPGEKATVWLMIDDGPYVRQMRNMIAR